MLRFLQSIFNVEKATLLITWGIVAGSALLLMEQRDDSAGHIAAAATCFVTFLVCFMIAVREESYPHDLLVRVSLMVIQYLAILGVYFLVPFTYTAILVTMWGGQLPHYMSFRKAILSSPVWSAPLWLIHTYYWDREFMLLSALLFWTFNLFALMMINATLKEQRAREASNELNRELMATQALLSQATKQAERVRIARNIHDLLGHHLTALTINLQVASRISQGQAQEKIDECHGLAKLLLSDVREAVSEIREKSNLELEVALKALLDNVPQMQIKMDYDPDLHITDVTVAETILRCVQESLTNSLKHSQANIFEIKLKERNNHIQLQIKDNGSNHGEMKLGNGLKGMRERVQEVGGTIQFESAEQGFLTSIEFPEYA